MTVGRVRWSVVGLLATVSAGMLTLMSTLIAAFAFGDDEGAVALIMGGTGREGGSLPSGLPTDEFFTGVVSRYIDPAEPFFPGQPVFPGFTPVPLATPEQDWPYTGLNSMTLDQSIAQGLTDLNTAITQTYAGDDIVALGYSQSATIATLEMNALAASGQGPNPADLHFVLLGDPNNPESGIYALQSLFPNVPDYYIPTPPDTPYPTDIYTIQYDGYADFPKYPIDLLADINAGMGMDYAHLEYASLTPEQLATAQLLPGSADITGVGETNYYLIPSQTLPLLEPLRQLEQAVPALQSVINPLIDLTQPDLKYLVDLGYADPFTTYANVPATPGLFPDVDPVTFLLNLDEDTVTGVNAALADVALPGLPQLGDAGLPELLSQLVPALPNFGELTRGLGGDIFGSAGSDLSTLLSALSGGLFEQLVTQVGVDVATLSSMAFEPTGIVGSIFGAL